jgi:hypothetical protein
MPSSLVFLELLELFAASWEGVFAAVQRRLPAPCRRFHRQEWNPFRRVKGTVGVRRDTLFSVKSP